MAEEWDKSAETWDTDPHVVEYRDKAFKEICKVLDPKEKTSLDFGCGTGLLLDKLHPLCKEITAIDISPKMIEKVQAKGFSNVTTICGELTEALVDEKKLTGTCDFVTASSVLAFVPSLKDSYKSIGKTLKPGGLLIALDWKKHGDFGIDDTMVKEASEYAGLEIVSISYPFSLTSEMGEMSVIMAVLKSK
eukprot:m.73232 g.73232  ORF g.73232 m.73232 type:complete len:191 (+) comp12390_c0_seq1:179-751(+)